MSSIKERTKRAVSMFSEYIHDFETFIWVFRHAHCLDLPMIYVFASFRNPACQRQFSSYRGTFEIPKSKWKTVRLPWSEFEGYGPGCDSTPFEASALRRIGIVAIGKEGDVCLGVAGLRFYNVI